VAPSGGNRRNEASVQQLQQQKQLIASRKIGQMCFVLTSVYSLLWTPFQLTLVARVSGVQSITLDKLATAYLLPNLNSCINPAIYGLMWKPFQQAFQQASGLLIIVFDGM
jgi:hypothetical protein